jgi:hypothetical protein
MILKSGAPSARSMLTSLVLHGLALAIALLVPTEALRHTEPPKKEIDLVFHRPKPIEIPAAAVPAPIREANAARPGPKRVTTPAPIVPPAPKPSAPEGPGQPDLPKGPEENQVVTEAKRKENVGKAGILAFKDQLASLAQDKKVAPRLGADARYGKADDVGQASSRSTLTTTTPGSSGGLNIASLSRTVGGGGGGSGSGGGGGGMDGVTVGRAVSSIAGIGGGDRPLAHSGPGPSRTDEEIQIVFDRYKAMFYRLYNRALRVDSTLKGQMVLRLTIEPDGSVSMCKLQSSDMNAPDLAAQVVNIVHTINFGAKDGVQALTISYPIDFLPAE